MRRLIIIFTFIIVSTSSHADPGKRATREERQVNREERRKARIERKYANKALVFDERGPEQKQRDRQAMFFLAIAAAVIVTAISKVESN
jgi:hypothetical protein